MLLFVCFCDRLPDGHTRVHCIWITRHGISRVPLSLCSSVLVRTPPLQVCKWAASRFRIQSTLEYPLQCELFEVYFVIPLCSLRPFLESIRVVELRVEEGLGFTRGA
jgi:hypothetical protein